MYLQKLISKKLMKKEGSGSESKRYGSASQWYGCPNPDPYQNVTDPQHW